MYINCLKWKMVVVVMAIIMVVVDILSIMLRQKI